MSGLEHDTSREEATRKLLFAAENAKAAVEISQLIRQGADVNAVDEIGRTPLMLAACHNSNPDVLQALLDNGADVNTADPNGWILLTLAADNSNPDVMLALIDKRATDI